MISIVFEDILKEVFQDKIVAKTSYKIEIIEEVIWDYKPDMLFVHCHTESRDFERIRVLTRNVSQGMPDCTIIVTYRPDVSVDYKEKYLNGYSCDIMLSDNSLTVDVIKEIVGIYQMKTAHKI
jgi:hypothetical protein